MEVIDVVNKLIGPIEPVADSSIDYKRLENLRAYCSVVDKMLFEIQMVANRRDSKFASVMTAGHFAHKFLNDIKEQ
jgi:hypothetical protein